MGEYRNGLLLAHWESVTSLNYAVAPISERNGQEKRNRGWLQICPTDLQSAAANQKHNSTVRHMNLPYPSELEREAEARECYGGQSEEEWKR
jgi:hypothetical protein